MDPAEARPTLTRSLLGKLLLLFLPMLVVSVLLFYSATEEAEHIHADLERLAEEDREARLSRDLLVELRGAESWVKRQVGDAERKLSAADLDEHLQHAAEVLSQLSFGPAGEDPSDREHQDREARLYRAMLKQLRSARETLRGRGDPQSIDSVVQQMRRESEVLEAETRAEARRSADDLDQRTQGLIWRLSIVGLALIITVLAMAWFFQRQVLRPLKQLRDATQRLGREGEYDPVALRSRDEFGQLGLAFDSMAKRLHSMHHGLEERVQQRTRELIRTARLADLGTMAAGIAHEINNPLASIATGVEGLGRQLRTMPDVDAATLEYIEVVGREAYRAKDITERLLRFGRQDATRIQPVWLAHELSEVISMLGGEARKSDLRFATHVPEDLTPVAWDPGECRQVFFNLLRNALHASPRGAAISVTASEEDGGVAVRVRDQGPGLAEEDLDRAFEPFFTTKPTGQGTGLGLAICERILSFRGGRIWARNHGEGAEFGFWLPQAE